MAPARRGSRGSASTAGRSSTGRKSVAAARPRRSAGNYDDDDDDDDDDEEEEAPVALRRPRRGSAMEEDDDDDDDDDESSSSEEEDDEPPVALRRPRRGSQAEEEEEEEEEDSSDESSSEESEAPLAARRPRRGSVDEDEPAPKRGRRDLDMLKPSRKSGDSPPWKLAGASSSSEEDDDDGDGVRRTRRAPKPRALMNVTGDTPNNGLGGRPRERKRARSPHSPTSGGRYKADSEEEAERRGRRRENLELPSYGMDSPERGGRDRRDRGRRRRSAPRRANPYFSTSDSSVEPRSKSDRKKDRLFSSAPVGEDSSSDDDDDDDDARPRGPPPAPKPFVGVAGLEGHLKSLEEMVLLPLKHPNLYASLGVAPPRGVLFHGPPGTGKTLLARQLAEACSAELVAQRKAGDKAAKKAHPGGVSFFVRNGADCLSKYVGEAERALSTLFEEARAKAPSIIFFDELDGLAPARGSGRGGGGGELAQHSVVATLLALMDGLSDRGDVVVIGATNRPDALDPALRRPGRFDRELKFVAPDAAQREAILALHTSSWAPASRPTPPLLKALAKRCGGFAGADLKALCAEAALAALRRGRPDLYARGADAAAPAAPPVVAPADFDVAFDAAAPAAFRRHDADAQGVVPAPLPRHREPLFGAAVAAAVAAVAGDGDAAAAAPATAFGYAVAAHRAPCRGAAAFARPRAVVLSAAAPRDRDVVAAAVLDALERDGAAIAHGGAGALLRDGAAGLAPDVALAARVRDARAAAGRAGAAVLFLPDVDEWWAHAHPQTKVALRALLLEAREDQALLVVATTAGGALDDDDVAVPDALAAAAEVAVPAPSKKAREAFWALGLGEVAAAFRAGLEAARLPAEEPAEDEAEEKAPSEVDESPAPSPAAPREPGEKEAHCLRELRVFLRAALRELKADRSLQALWRPVDPEESPEYFAVVQSPMDLSVVRAKVDGGLYPTLRHFLSDVRVVRENAAAFRAAALGHARADDLAHAAANAEDLARSMAHRFQKKVGWDLVAKCDAFHKKRAEGSERGSDATPPKATAAPAPAPRPPPRARKNAPDRAADEQAVADACAAFEAALDRKCRPAILKATKDAPAAALEAALNALFDALDDGEDDDESISPHGLAEDAAARVAAAAAAL